MGKSDCPVCHKSARQIASNKSGSVQCAVCSLWYHLPCAKVEDGKLEMIYKCVEMGMNSPWSCTVCETGLAKVAKDVKENRARIGNLETGVETLGAKQDQMVEKTRNQDTRMDLQDKRIKELEEHIRGLQGGSGEKVLEEINERGSRERNLLVHKCQESDAADDKDCKEDDMEGAQSLFDHLGLNMSVDNVLIGVRRLGQNRTDGQPRPLLLIFKRKEDRDMLIDRAPRLSRDQEEYWRNISVVADLTLKQRQMEQAMFKTAEELNLARTAEDQSKNLVHKVLGKRGERVLRQVQLRPGEVINEEGKVILEGEEEGRKRKRQNSPQGISPAARRVRTGRRFGRAGGEREGRE